MSSLRWTLFAAALLLIHPARVDADEIDDLEQAYTVLGGAVACSDRVIHVRDGASVGAPVVGSLAPNSPSIPLKWSSEKEEMGVSHVPHRGFLLVEAPLSNISGWVRADELSACGPTDPDARSMVSYRRSAAVAYAYKWVFSANHRCGTHSKCGPYSYWGWEVCGYRSQGGDCANFVSQCLVEAGHPLLRGGDPCRGYPCGREEIGAKRLGDCLSQRFKWKRTCGHRRAPPAGIKVGDVLIYHAQSCSSYSAHSTIVTKVSSASNVYVTGHSSNAKDAHYDYLSGSKPYYEWLQAST